MERHGIGRLFEGMNDGRVEGWRSTSKVTRHPLLAFASVHGPAASGTVPFASSAGGSQ